MRFTKVRFLSVSEVTALHEQMLRIGGGADGLFRHQSLDSSVMGVQATFGGEPVLKSLADIAAGYAFYIAKDHPFIDGNKRTALMSAVAFLEENGFELTLMYRKDWQDLMVRVADGKLSREQLAEFFAAAMGEWGHLTWGRSRRKK